MSSPTVEQKNTFSGSVRDVRGDLNLGDRINNYFNQDGAFQLESLPLLSSPAEPGPRFRKSALALLEKHNFLVVGGNYAFDKARFLRQVARGEAENGSQVTECRHFSDVNELINAIRKKDADWDVMLINDVQPTKLNSRLRDLFTEANKSARKVLLSTNTPVVEWHFGNERLPDFWFAVPDQIDYKPEELIGYLKNQLVNLAIDYEVQLEDVIEEISTVEDIDAFVIECRKREAVITSADAEEIIGAIHQRRSTGIAKWFTTLPLQDQLLAIGVCLLNGLYESQFFELMDRILAVKWRPRNSALEHIDYSDIHRLFTYFGLDATSGEVSVKDPRQRMELLRFAWRTHRRYIISALPILTDAMIESTEKKLINYRLYGKMAYRRKVREVVASTYSDIGTFALSEIEGELLRMASSDHLMVRAAAAAAIGNWKERGLAEQMYTLLEEWHSNAEKHQLVEANIRASGQDSSFTEELLAHVRIQATTALAITTGVQSDPIGQPALKSLAIYDRLAEITHPEVDAAYQFALEKFVSRQLPYLKDKLRKETLVKARLQHVVGKSVANYHDESDPEVAREVITEWLDWAREQNEGRHEFDALQHQDIVQAAAISALTQIDYELDDANAARITLKETYEILERLRKEVHQPELRSYLLKAIVRLIEINFATNGQITINLISNVDEREREGLVKIFRENYLNEREAMEGGEYAVTLDDLDKKPRKRTISFWREEDDRPATKVEELLRQWKNSEVGVLQQIALKSFLAIDRIEQRLLRIVEKHEKIKLRVEEEREEYEEKTYDGEIAATRESELFLKLCSPFVAPHQVQVLRQISIIILQEDYTGGQGRVNDAEARRLIKQLDDDPTDQDTNVIDSIYYLYSLFRGEEFRKLKNPKPQSIRSTIFYLIGGFMVKDREVHKALSPYLFDTPDLSLSDGRFLLERFNDRTREISAFYMACRYPLYILGGLVLCYLLIKMMFND